ncbi:hypothetical protein ABFS82_11G017800 [Erythranthe guttata]
MAGSRVAHATLKGPSVVKEILIGIALGFAAGSVWKMHHWNEQRKVRSFYDMLDKAVQILPICPKVYIFDSCYGYIYNEYLSLIRFRCYFISICSRFQIESRVCFLAS